MKVRSGMETLCSQNITKVSLLVTVMLEVNLLGMTNCVPLFSATNYQSASVVVAFDSV